MCSTRKRVNGSSIFGDRFVEWTIRDLRVFLGDHDLGDYHTSHVHRISLLLNEKKILRNVMKKGSANTTNVATQQRHLRINKVYCETFLYFMQNNIWGVESPIHVPAKPWMERKGMDPSEWEVNNGTTLSGNVVVNPDMCFIYSEGLKRWAEYFRKFLVEGGIHETSRTETDKDVNLKLLNSTMDELDEREKDDVSRAVSTDFEFVNKKGVYSLVELKPELRLLNDMLPEGTEKVNPKVYRQQYETTTKKAHIARAVVRARELLMEANPHWATERAAQNAT